MFTVIQTDTGSDWGQFTWQEAAVRAADDFARVLKTPFHVTAIVHIANPKEVTA